VYIYVCSGTSFSFFLDILLAVQIRYVPGSVEYSGIRERKVKYRRHGLLPKIIHVGVPFLSVFYVKTLLGTGSLVSLHEDNILPIFL
jgi:hypothetical protein